MRPIASFELYKKLFLFFPTYSTSEDIYDAKYESGNFCIFYIRYKYKSSFTDCKFFEDLLLHMI